MTRFDDDFEGRDGSEVDHSGPDPVDQEQLQTEAQLLLMVGAVVGFVSWQIGLSGWWMGIPVGISMALTFWKPMLKVAIIIVGLIAAYLIHQYHEKERSEAIERSLNGFVMTCKRLEHVVERHMSSYHINCNEPYFGYIDASLNTEDNKYVISDITYNHDTQCLEWARITVSDFKGGNVYKSITMHNPLTMSEVVDSKNCSSPLRAAIADSYDRDRKELYDDITDQQLQEIKSKLTVSTQQRDRDIKFAKEKAQAKRQQKELEGNKRTEFLSSFSTSLYAYASFSNNDADFNKKLESPFNLNSDIMESFQRGAPYEVAKVDLNDDGELEYIVRQRQCQQRPCWLIIQENGFSGTKPSLKEISSIRHDGPVWISNEKICGYRVLVLENNRNEKVGILPIEKRDCKFWEPEG
jgi:hypothetical protein